MSWNRLAWPPPTRPAAVRRVLLLSWLTLGWLALDGIVGMTAGINANSVALIGWGLDCGIEAVAALIIVWRFSGSRVLSDEADTVARKVVAASFFLLVPYIVVEAIDQLVIGGGARPSRIGAALAAFDAILMPVLGSAKKRVGAVLGSQAAAGAGRQNIICAYLSVAVLVGLAANLARGLWWADPTAALLVAVVCAQAGWHTWRGERCEEVSPSLLTKST
ncbi:MAG: cation transporter [Jatrophihabitans sp.]|uniref:cation transporter n=1 Tax=Jatrophihabitans sp. TaxID=1932789 RepID=UPI003911B335